MGNPKRNRLHSMIFIALMTAVISITAPVSIPLPFSPVPLSLTTFVLYLALYVLGAKYALFSTLLYLALGLMGVPVFSGFGSGIGKLLGPTGGYLIGYLCIPLVGGLFFRKSKPTFLSCCPGLVLGTAICHLCGTLWLAFQTNLSLPVAFATGVLPFLPGDLCKIIAALLLGPQIQKRLQRANIAS